MNTISTTDDYCMMRAPIFVKGDLDGFFGLFIDNLLQLMVIAVLCQAVCGFPPELIYARILPGAAVSILLGNLFYAWQARRLAIKTGRDDVTALPYGINTPSVIAYIFLIMGPIYSETRDYHLAWQVGLFACFLSGVMETVGAFVADLLRKHTPRAALLSALAGIAITFIAMNFIFQIFATPIIAILPMMIILLSYAGHVKFGLVPGGLLAVLVGTLIALGLNIMGYNVFKPPEGSVTISFFPAVPVIGDLTQIFTSKIGWQYISVIFPMGLFNVIGSLQNLESAEAAGDRFETMPSLLANGIGSLAAAVFGSAFPTTIYIGHPGWKAMGARSGYSILNGLVITVLCFSGAVSLVLKVIPLEAVIGILLWIGLIISAQAFQESPKAHALAVVLGIIPSIASWAKVIIETALQKAGTTLFATASKFGSDLFIYGILSLSQGFILSSMILAAILVHIIDRQFVKAGVWTLAAAIFSAIGLIHAFELTEAGVQNKFCLMAAPHFFWAYLITAILLFALGLKKNSNT